VQAQLCVPAGSWLPCATMQTAACCCAVWSGCGGCGRGCAEHHRPHLLSGQSVSVQANAGRLPVPHDMQPTPCLLCVLQYESCLTHRWPDPHRCASLQSTLAFPALCTCLGRARGAWPSRTAALARRQCVVLTSCMGASRGHQQRRSRPPAARRCRLLSASPRSGCSGRCCPAAPARQAARQRK
jgi:hypothetical protein